MDLPQKFHLIYRHTQTCWTWAAENLAPSLRTSGISKPKDLMEYKQSHTCNDITLLGSNGGASDTVLARNTGLKEENGTWIYERQKNKTLDHVLDITNCSNSNRWYLPIAIFLFQCQSLKCNQECPNHCLCEQWFYIYGHHLLGGTPNHHMQKDFQVLRNSEI